MLLLKTLSLTIHHLLLQYMQFHLQRLQLLEIFPELHGHEILILATHIVQKALTGAIHNNHFILYQNILILIHHKRIHSLHLGLTLIYALILFQTLTNKDNSAPNSSIFSYQTMHSSIMPTPAALNPTYIVSSASISESSKPSYGSDHKYTPDEC